jgi:hypothetical protein
MITFWLEVGNMNGMTLICSKDMSLSHTRALMLSRIGMPADIAVDVPGVKSLCDKGRVQLAILCHTLSDFERMAITDMIRSRYEGTPVLTLCTGNGCDRIPQSQHIFCVYEGPGAFMLKCETLVGRQKAQTQSQALPAC